MQKRLGEAHAHVAHAKSLDEQSKLLEAGFEYVRFSDKDQIAIYRKKEVE